MLCRFYTTAARAAYSTSRSSPQEIASEFLHRCQSRGPIVQTQIFDANQLQRLSQALNRPALHPNVSVTQLPPKIGTPLPPAYHLAYFTPSTLEAELGADGSDRTFNPASPFTRRMWAGGKIEWSQENELCVGDTVTETTMLLSAQAKRTRDGVDMIVVGVEKRFENQKGVAVVDNRNWLFRPELTEAPKLMARGEAKPLPEGAHIRDFCQTPVSLFRFSALTFNGHKIHYSREWCRNFEGHRDIVVHGPLNLINMLDVWRDTKGGHAGRTPKSVTYRALSPVYAEEPYRAVLEDSGAGATEVKLWTEDGRLAMQGTITCH